MQSAQSNVSSAQDMLSTGESALQQVKDKLTQIRSYVADATDPTKDRTALAANIKSLASEITNIFKSTKFNNTALLSGATALSSVGTGGVGTTANLASLSSSFTFQTGSDSSDRINLDFASGLASGGTSTITLAGGNETLGLASDIASALNSFSALNSTDDTTAATDIANLASFTGTGADTSSTIGKFEKLVTESLGKIGNYQQRLTVKEDYLTSAISNAQSSVSRLFDADMALEQLNSTKAQVGASVATNMLSSLNSSSQKILSLFQ
jgi:flagellin